MGPELEQFEEVVAEYSGCKYALVLFRNRRFVACPYVPQYWSRRQSTGSRFFFFATAGVVSRLNAEPVFLEIDPTTFNLCPKHLEEKLEGYTEEELAKVKAVIPVHLLDSADMQSILDVVQRFGIA